LRFAIHSRDEDSKRERGLFTALYELRDAGQLTDYETEHITRMRALAALLDHKDTPVAAFETDKPGYVVYEDEHQVAAIPFGRETFSAG